MNQNRFVGRLVEENTLKDYVETATMLRTSRTRMAQMMKVLELSPQIQEQILAGEAAGSERGLRAVAGEAVWERQGGV